MNGFEQRSRQFFPGPPIISFPSGEPADMRDVLSNDGLINLVTSSPKSSIRVSLRTFLASDVANKNILMGTPPQYLHQALQHYWRCKADAPKHTSLCVLINTQHEFFPKWRTLLHGMKRVPCPHLPGYAFWADASFPTPIKASVNALGRSACSMVFPGLAGGSPAQFLLDSRASHCFIDKTFAETNGFALFPADASVTMANGNSATVSQCTAPIKLRLQRHTSNVVCFVVDMLQQYDLILGDDWLVKHKVKMDFETRACYIFKHGVRHTLPCAPKQTTPPPSADALLLNATQVARLHRQMVAPRTFSIMVHASEDSNSHHAPSLSVQHLLQKYPEVFEPRTTLPPKRNIAHTIPLEQGHS